MSRACNLLANSALISSAVAPAESKLGFGGSFRHLVLAIFLRPSSSVLSFYSLNLILRARNLQASFERHGSKIPCAFWIAVV
jgi:hypothetical protein